MQIRVIEVLFKEPRVCPTPQRGGYFNTDEQVVARLAVEVDGERLEVQSAMCPHAARGVPYEVIMGELRRKMMSAVEQRLFGDFNRRAF